MAEANCPTQLCHWLRPPVNRPMINAVSRFQHFQFHKLKRGNKSQQWLNHIHHGKKKFPPKIPAILSGEFGGISTFLIAEFLKAIIERIWTNLNDFERFWANLGNFWAILNDFFTFLNNFQQFQAIFEYFERFLNDFEQFYAIFEYLVRFLNDILRFLNIVSDFERFWAILKQFLTFFFEIFDRYLAIFEYFEEARAVRPLNWISRWLFHWFVAAAKLVRNVSRYGGGVPPTERPVVTSSFFFFFFISSSFLHFSQMGNNNKPAKTTGNVHLYIGKLAVIFQLIWFLWQPSAAISWGAAGHVSLLLCSHWPFCFHFSRPASTNRISKSNHRPTHFQQTFLNLEIWIRNFPPQFSFFKFSAAIKNWCYITIWRANN